MDTSHVLRRALRYAAIASFVLIAAAVAWTLGPGAGWVLRHVDGVHGLHGKDLEDALDAVRGRALAVATGLAALLAVYYTARNADTARRTLQHSEESARKALQHSEETARRTAELTEQGQVTERYTKAIEQLGNKDSVDIRIGGIYALERIAADSARDHPTVMEVLTAFIREHAAPKPTIPEEISNPAASPGHGAPARLGADIQAALTVIGRRAVERDTRLIDLTATNLAGALLTDAHLKEAKLTDADLNKADLDRADLTGAYLADTNLARADLNEANLTCAFLYGADLAGADLIGAHLTNANLTGVNLTGAHLNDADLTGAVLTGAYLTGAQLHGVRYSSETLWPEDYSLGGSSA